MASGYKGAEPLTSKNSDEVTQAFQKICKPGPLKWPELLVDHKCEFMGAVIKEMEKYKTEIQHRRTEIHCYQAIVKPFLIISAQSQLLLLVGDHSAILHLETSVCRYVLVAIQLCFETISSDFVLLLQRDLRARV